MIPLSVFFWYWVIVIILLLTAYWWFDRGGYLTVAAMWDRVRKLF